MPDDAALAPWTGPEELRGMLVEIESLNHDPANARLHDEANLRAIADSLRQFGQDQPLVVRAADRVVLKGNGRMEAARDMLGWTHVAAVLVDDDAAKGIARALADNRAAELGTWDLPVLADQMRLADAGGYELPALGFDEDYAAPLLDADWSPPPLDDVKVPDEKTEKAEGEAAEEQAGEEHPKGDVDETYVVINDEPVSVAGATYRLGTHTITCGEDELRFVDSVRRGWAAHALANALDVLDGITGDVG